MISNPQKKMTAEKTTIDNKPSPAAVTKIDILFRDIPTFLQSYMAHLNQGGLFIKTDSPLSLDTTVLLKITLPDTPDPIETQGSVVLSNPCKDKGYFPKGMGVKFVNLKPEDSDKIISLTGSNKSKTDDLSIF